MTSDDDRDQLLRDARERIVDRFGADIKATSRDFGGRHGFVVECDRYTLLLTAKARRHTLRGGESIISFSFPVLAKALERDLWLCLHDQTVDRLVVYDAGWVREHGKARRVDSKRADDVGVRDVPPWGGVALRQFLRGERPEAVDRTRDASLSEVEA